MISRDTLLSLIGEYGFFRARILNTRDTTVPFTEGSILLCALSCYRDEPDDASTPGDPHGLIAPFARRNYYREAVSRLQEVVKRISREGLTRREARIFSNSRFPEKILAARSGLGFYGRNSLIISPGMGSLFVIAGLYLPVSWPSDPPLPGDPGPGGHCGTCRACIDACPVGAISESGAVDRSLCLQALSTECRSFSPPVEELWQYRLYGCRICQDVCPFNKNLSVETATGRGELGPSLSLKEILVRSPQELKIFFKGTVLDRSWIPPEAIQRNAVLAAGNRGNPVLLPLILRHKKNRLPWLRDAAEWSEQKIRSSGKLPE
jgi:epoxyqueuosine reductase